MNLEVLELGGCCNIINIGFLFIVWGFCKLKILNFRSCCYILDVGIGYLVGNSLNVVVGILEIENLGL